MSDYTLTKREYRNLKSRLTRVQNAGDPEKIIKEVDHAMAIFEQKGSPDDWHRWQGARDDAELQLRLRRPFKLP